MLPLPPELVVQVGGHLDLPSTLHLASTCPTFLRHLSSPAQWRLILKRVGPLDKEMVGALATFLTTTISMVEVVQEVVEHICTSDPPNRNSHGRVDRIALSSTSTTSLTTSPAGVLLLHQLGVAGVHLGTRVVEVQVEGVSTSKRFLTALTWLAGHQEEEVEELECLLVQAWDGGRELGELLRRCRRWWVQSLHLEGEGSRGWESLAAAAPRGRVGWLWTSREVLVEGAREHLRTVWEVTVEREREGWGGAGGWGVDGREVVREGREEEGWGEVLEILDMDWQDWELVKREEEQYREDLEEEDEEEM